MEIIFNFIEKDDQYYFKDAKEGLHYCVSNIQFFKVIFYNCVKSVQLISTDCFFQIQIVVE